MNFHKEYYKILGVEKDATREQLKSAYRKLVMQNHPDRNPDNAAAEERMKEINEAFEILDSDINRFVYDEYKRNEEKVNQEHKAATNGSNQVTPNPNKRTYEKKTTVRTERRVYIRGSITIKFWAEQENDLDLFTMKEINYRLNPVSAEALITQSDIHDFIAPIQFQKVYKEAQIFKTPLPTYTKCKITGPNKPEEYYDLSLQDVRIVDPILTDIVKYEKQSLGTLKGEFYAYVLRVDEEEITEIVTECFGETGKTERKTEGETELLRIEYYHKDCTTYWGPWIKVVKPQPASKAYSRKAQTPIAASADYQGCSQYLWVPALLFLLFVWPQFFLGLLAIVLFGLLFSLGSGLLRRLLPILSLVLLGLFIYTSVNSNAGNSRVGKRKFEPAYDTLKSTKESVVQDTISNSDDKYPDTLISHFIRWSDYDSITYALTLSVTASDLRMAIEGHNNFEPAGFYTSLSPVYHYLERADQVRLGRIYTAFDSVKRANGLNNITFAKMVVSCIQSIPYYLVMDKLCTADYSDDEFTYTYLQQCTSECCIGNTKFGVRSPVEFMSDLKGDCDTRALIIYSVLKKFNYDVALLTSQYYKHAIVAVSFENEIPDGLAININNKNYYLWETTSVGFRPGQVPVENRNLSHWDIALLNENK